MVEIQIEVIIRNRRVSEVKDGEMKRKYNKKFYIVHLIKRIEPKAVLIVHFPWQ